MQSSTGRLFLGFWSLSLRNLPVGSIQHRLIDVAAAAHLISAAREAGLLRCGSSVDLVAPYKAREALRHAQFCDALSKRLNIPVALDDFLNTDDEGLTIAFPLGIIRPGAGDRLLIVDCGYQMNESATGKVEDRLDVAESSIEFHLFEPGRIRPSLEDLLAATDLEGAARVNEAQSVAPIFAIEPGAAEPGYDGRASGKACDS